MKPAATDLETLLRSELSSRLDGRLEMISGQPVCLDARACTVLSPVLCDFLTEFDAHLGMAVAWWCDEQGRCVIELNTVGQPCERRPAIRDCAEQTGVFQRSAEGMIRFEVSDRGARIVVPARYVAETHFTLGSPSAAGGGSADPLAGRSVLVVEDQLIIALDLEMLLQEQGAATVHLSGSVEDALRSIGSDRPDIAILDVNLGNTTSFPVARELQRLGVPFIFATGYGNEIEFPPELRSVPLVGKPYCIETMREALRSTCLVHA